MNVAVLGTCVDQRLAIPILAGAVLPDVPIFVLYAYGRWGRGLPEARIWSDLYPRRGWLNLIHGLHSAPLALLGAVAGMLSGHPGVAAFFASMLLHSAADFPIHGKDAHRHFLPFTSYRFVSPLSYWDVEHHAKQVALVELMVVGASALVIGLWGVPWGVRAALAAVLVWYAVEYRRLLAGPPPRPQATPEGG